MKKTLAFLLLFAFTFSFLAAANAESKIIRKTIQKVVRPEITPSEPPEVGSESIPPETAEVPKYEFEKAGTNKGINFDLGIGFLMGQSVLVGRGNIILADPMKIGAELGLAEDALEYKVGLGVASGNDNSGNSINAIPLFADATLYLKEKSFFGFDPFVGFGLNYNLYGSGQQTGGFGTGLYAGILNDFGFSGGKTAFTLGLQNIKVNYLRSASGLLLSVSQPFTL